MSEAAPIGYYHVSHHQPEYLQKCEVLNEQGRNPRLATWLGDRFGGYETRHIEGETWYWKPLEESK